MALWIAPVAGWTAMLFGAGLAWGLIRWVGQGDRPWNRQTQGSFLLASMFGNTGYIGFPVSLALVGPQYFAWALFYDMIVSTLGSYGLGVVMASQFGIKRSDRGQFLQVIFKNPTLWSFAIGLAGRDIPLPNPVEIGLQGIAWCVISLALLLVGMRLRQIPSIRSIKLASVSLGIKMLLVPLLFSILLKACGVTGLVHRAILLQMAMPPAFATLVLAEAYELDQEMTVTALAIGSLALLVMLPVWLWLSGGFL
jgi:predicted permease